MKQHIDIVGMTKAAGIMIQSMASAARTFRKADKAMRDFGRAYTEWYIQQARRELFRGERR